MSLRDDAEALLRDESIAPTPEAGRRVERGKGLALLCMADAIALRAGGITVEEFRTRQGLPVARVTGFDVIDREDER